MSDVKFKPFVGKNYTTGICGKRIMVLGESHYCAHESEAIPEITNNIIVDLWNSDSEHEGFKNTYTKFIKALSGTESVSFEEKREWWNKVLFYNYVQVAMSQPRESPSASDFRNSETAFFEVLNQYCPDCILVWGRRLYEHLPRKGKQLADLETSQGAIETWSYALLDGKEVSVLPVLHPSAGFTPSYWHEAITQFIKR